MNRRLMSALAIALLAVTGCGGGPAPLTAPGGSLNAAQIAQSQAYFTMFLQNLQPNTNPTNSNFPDGVGFLEESPYESCRTETPATPVDDDNDSIPVLQEIKYNCLNVSHEGFFNDVVGTTKVQDLDDTKTWSAGGYRYDYDLSYAYNNGATHDFAFNFQGFYASEPTATSLNLDSDFMFSLEGKEHGQQLKFTYQSTLKSVYEPVDMNAPYANGTLNMEGFFKLEGMFGEGAGSGSVVFKISVDDLVYEYPGCTRYYKSGTMTFEDGANNKLVYTFNCTADPTITLNGSPLP